MGKIHVFHLLALSYGLKRKAFTLKSEQSLTEMQKKLITEFNAMASKGRGLKLLYLLSHLVAIPFIIYTWGNGEKDVLLNHAGGLSLLGTCTALLVFISVHLYEFWYRNFKLVLEMRKLAKNYDCSVSVGFNWSVFVVHFIFHPIYIVIQLNDQKSKVNDPGIKVNDPGIYGS